MQHAERLLVFARCSTVNDNPKSEYILNNRTSFWETKHIIINIFFVSFRNNWDVNKQCWPLCLDDLWTATWVRYDMTWSAIGSTESREWHRPKCRIGYCKPYHWLLPYRVSTKLLDETKRVCRCQLPSQTPLSCFARLDGGRPVLVDCMCIPLCSDRERQVFLLQLFSRLYCEMLHF